MIRFIFLLLTGSIVYAQSNRFYYELKFKPDTIANQEIKEFFITDINPKSVKYFSLIDYKNDSITKNVSPESRYERTQLYHYIKRDRNSFDNINYLSAGSTPVQLKSHDEMKWSILPETKMMGSIKVQAARTHFGGRQWTAWFAESIPFPEGPYKFRGLPGMILEIYDDRRYYHFTLVRNKVLDKEYNTSGIVETFFGEKPLLIDKKKYIQLKLQEYADPLADMKGGNMPTLIDEHGNKISVDFKQMTIEAQRELKSNNNFIEKEFIINYK
ncbi:GLPGLI family protein [Chryseobacterium gallinarum]|uniref:GLPGLI family protein n=1 Tax=Chryseobacterium gallinarum TaxID=1324352 RepID=A0ABX6KSM9_CHRGL|nr:GLPGLI family protein [Chryseobacterium gallinarum]QIY91621.1 GLPGLI family protein [Chryseobacterium gallinarum]